MIRSRSNIIRHNNIYFNIFWQRSLIVSFLLLSPLLIFFNFYFLLRRKKLWLRFWLPSFNWKLKPLFLAPNFSHLLKILYMAKLIRLFTTISLLMLSFYWDFYKLFWNARYYLPGLVGKFNFKLFYINNTSVLQIFHFNSTSSKNDFTNFFSNRIYWITFFRLKHFSIHSFVQKFLFINFLFLPHLKFFDFFINTRLNTQVWSFGNLITNKPSFDEKLIQTSPAIMSDIIFSAHYPNQLVSSIYFCTFQSLIITFYMLVIQMLLFCFNS